MYNELYLAICPSSNIFCCKFHMDSLYWVRNRIPAKMVPNQVLESNEIKSSPQNYVNYWAHPAFLIEMVPKKAIN